MATAYTQEQKRRMAIIGRKIADARKNKGLSQQQFADRLSFVIYSGTIAKWENGVQAPHTTFIAEIADALGVTIEHLLRHDS